MRSLVVVVTGVCGKIAYSLFGSLCTGYIFGTELEFELRLVDVDTKADQLSILKEELVDCCFSNVKSISTFTNKDHEIPFINADVVIFLGGMPRQPGQDRNDVYQSNAEVFQKQGRYLDKYANKTCKCLVVANPTCTNCMVLAKNAPSLPRQNFTALTRLDYNRFVGQTAKILNCKPSQIKNIIVWGNHSRKEFWDASRLEVLGSTKEEIAEKTKLLNIEVLEKQMYERGGFIQGKTKGNAHISATKAIADHLRDWFQGSDRAVSMGVITTKEMYGIPPGLCFSMPTTCLGGGQFKILENLELTNADQKRLVENRDELLKEQAIVANFLPENL